MIWRCVALLTKKGLSMNVSMCHLQNLYVFPNIGREVKICFMISFFDISRTLQNKKHNILFQYFESIGPFGLVLH